MSDSAQVSIATDAIRVTVNPQVGGTITEIVHRPSGLSVLGRVPWDPVDAPIASFAARDEPEWLTRYTGGWPLLFPNGGDACTVDGMFHGFHGEASIAPWRWEASARQSSAGAAILHRAGGDGARAQPWRVTRLSSRKRFACRARSPST